MATHGDTDRPLVTYAITTYRHAPYIRRAVQAALAQTYAPLEILIFDDCSPDATFDIIQDEVSRYTGPHTVITRRNAQRLGVFGNGHQVYREFRGKFLVLADGDDVSHPDRTARMVEAWQRTGASMVTSNAVFVDSAGTKALRYWHDPNVEPDVSLRHLALSGSSACTFGAGVGLDRIVIDEFGLVPTDFDSGDLILAFWAGLLGGCHFIREALVHYRVHTGNDSGGRSVDRAQGVDRAVLLERQWYTHMGIALYEAELLDSFVARHPEKAALAQEVRPLLYAQALRHAQSLISVRRELDAAGLRKMGESLPSPLAAIA